MYGNRKKGLKNISNKLTGLLVFAFICTLLLIYLVNLFAYTSGGVSAFISGESIWSKAQKKATIHLSSYIVTGNSDQYLQFDEALSVNLGQRRARIELLKEDYDYQIIHQNLVEGGIPPEDIPKMVSLIEQFKSVGYIQNALDAWKKGDDLIDSLITLSETIHVAIEVQDSLTSAQKTSWMQELQQLENKLSIQEARFAEKMQAAARFTNKLIKWTSFAFGIILIAVGIWLAYRLVKNTNVLLDKLQESNDNFKEVLSNSKDVIYKMDIASKKYEYVSPAFEQMLGYTTEQFLNGGVEFIVSLTHPDDLERMREIIKEYETVKDEDFPPVLEFRVKDKEGNWIWISNVRKLLRNDKGEPVSIIGSVRDISNRKKHEQLVKDSLKEKETLLQEIHHRVKNNLSIVSSLLELQKDGVSPEFEALLSSSQSRIKSIAKVHEKLYESPTLSNISLDKYIEELAQEISNAYASKEKDIELHLEVSPIQMNIDDAIPVGLILNELINNAFKHAFNGLDKGTIKISLQQNEKDARLCVSNNGNKLKDGFDPSQSDSLGMTLIQVLIQRLEGTLSIESDEWTRFVIHFNPNNF